MKDLSLLFATVKFELPFYRTMTLFRPLISDLGKQLILYAGHSGRAV
jgi:hypothetical protein